MQRATSNRGSIPSIRVLLPLGWVLAAVGYYGAWIAHDTAAMILSGADMGEFVKFLPDVLSGSLGVLRQLFYLPPLAIVLSVALLVGCRRLRYPWLLRIAYLFLAILVSLQLLPPAWSLNSLQTPEFRAQAIALGACWLALAGFWLWGALPIRQTGWVSGALALAAVILTAWQFALVRPAIHEVYRTRPMVGWGFYLCLAGLVVTAAASVLVALQNREGSSSL